MTFLLFTSAPLSHKQTCPKPLQYSISSFVLANSLSWKAGSNALPPFLRPSSSPLLPDLPLLLHHLLLLLLIKPSAGPPRPGRRPRHAVQLRQRLAARPRVLPLGHLRLLVTPAPLRPRPHRRHPRQALRVPARPLPPPLLPSPDPSPSSPPSAPSSTASPPPASSRRPLRPPLASSLRLPPAPLPPPPRLPLRPPLVADAESLFLRPILFLFPFPLLLPSPSFPPDTKVYNLLLRGWLKVRRWRRCRELWLDMDRNRVPKDLHSYAVYMDALSKSGKPWNAVRLFKEMARKFAPDAVAYNTAIHALGLSQGADSSIRLYREMLDAGCPPNAATYNTILKLLCKEGRFREAYSFVSRMKKHGCEPNALTYHCFFQYLNRPQEVLALFERMLERGCRPRTDTYVMLIKRFGRWGFLRPVFVVWKKMEEHGCSPDAFAYNTLIDALLQRGMVEMARKYDEEMLAKGLSPKPRKELGSKRSDEDNSAVLAGNKSSYSSAVKCYNG
ncbi:Pentatricopeptide repeat-containing protein, mitochondrial [Ananas comosus]|uniref:Pentatricopeptide repeat-containing protein, mitochondrial n=1 Tax=Ananas comosus TaxID=4615 RepID=A0A199W1Y8_ANACO|nr:Pentatricopeptide repeat-containing protein, mitochondrial [Ananas comosus]